MQIECLPFCGKLFVIHIAKKKLVEHRNSVKISVEIPSIFDVSEIEKSLTRLICSRCVAFSIKNTMTNNFAGVFVLIQAIINECANHLPTSIEMRKFYLPLNRKYLRAEQLCEEMGKSEEVTKSSSDCVR